MRPTITVPNTKIAIESYEILGQDAKKIQIKLVNYQLFFPVTIICEFLTASGAFIASDRFTLSTDQVATWGTDDNTLVDIIIDHYGLTKTT